MSKTRLAVSKKRTSRKAGSRRTSTVVALVLCVILGVVVVTTLTTGLLVRADIGCSACHTMRPYIEASLDTSHASVECSSCHATRGLLGIPADGFRAISWLGGTAPMSSSVGNNACLSCHDGIVDGVTESRGIAVQHSDFLELQCVECHAGTGHIVADRWYRVLEMDDCTTCHSSTGANPEQCDTCHVPDSDSERREGQTAWRATHGPGWQTTHGMGSLDACVSCHVPVFCIKCHEVKVPHSPTWLVTHGAETLEVGADSCPTCHETTWCSDCHGVEMPHPSGFMAVHGPEAEKIGDDACTRCHDARACDQCHFAASHPNVPGVGMGHDG